MTTSDPTAPAFALDAEQKAGIRGELAHILEIDEAGIAEDDDLKEVHGAESLDRIEVVSYIERTLPVKFERADIGAIHTLADFYRITEERLNSDETRQ
jgi:acyl carrier protein